MKDGNKDTNPNEDVDEKDDDLLDGDTKDKDVLDDILDDDKDDKKDTEDKKDTDEDIDENKNKDEKKVFYKKIGNHEFNSSDDYDEFVTKTYSQNSSLAGEIKKLGGNPKDAISALDDEKKEVKEDEKKEVKEPDSPEKIYYKVQLVGFKKEFPETKEYAEIMATFIRAKKADINGEPSFALALGKSLRADGKELPEKLRTRIKSERGIEDSEPQSVKKKIMKSGGNRAMPSQETYDDDAHDDLNDFANTL